MDNRITRESMNMITEEIVEIMASDWLSDDSKRTEIERIIVNNGLATVIENENFNSRELALIEDIRNAEQYIYKNNELEIDLYGDGWYACEYNGDESRILQDYSNEPLITESEIEKESVDMYKVFNYCGVAYCG